MGGEPRVEVSMLSFEPSMLPKPLLNTDFHSLVNGLDHHPADKEILDLERDTYAYSQWPSDNSESDQATSN